MFVRVARQRTSFVAEQRRLTLCSHCSIVLEKGVFCFRGEVFHLG